MNDPAALATSLEVAFTRILDEQMAGIPILNERLRVQAVDFQAHQGRPIGVLITPWVMNLMVFPGDQDDWEALEVGHKLTLEFPAQTHELTINEIDELGKCQTYSLYSPMREFQDQAHAVTVARKFLDDLMTEQDLPIDEFDSDDFNATDLAGESPTKTRLNKESREQSISRRDLLRGRFRRTD